MAENEDDLLAGRKSVLTGQYQSIAALNNYLSALEQNNQIIIILLDLTEFVVNIDSTALQEDLKAARKSLLWVQSS